MVWRCSCFVLLTVTLPVACGSPSRSFVEETAGAAGDAGATAVGGAGGIEPGAVGSGGPAPTGGSTGGVGHAAHAAGESGSSSDAGTGAAPSGSGGAGGYDASTEAGQGGGPETGGDAGAGGEEPTCIAGRAVCIGGRPMKCNPEGTGYLGTGTVCSSSETCVSGACVEQECVPSEPFCSGNTVRLCADNGLSSEETEVCESDEYCDIDSSSCRVGVCAPEQPACDGDRATTCNADGSGYASGGTECDGGTSCDAGECKPQVCTPGATFCQDLTVKLCSDNGLTSSVESVCTDQTCVASGDTAACTGVCAPDQQHCSENRVQSCSATGTWTDAGSVDCSPSNKTCVESDGSATCTGVCAPGQLQCSEELVGIQTCTETGQWGTVDACEGQTCVDSSGTPTCTGVCTHGKTSCAGNGVRTCSPSGRWDDPVACPASTPQCASGACGAPNSCTALASTCGPLADQSCCTSPLVEGGAFDRINDAMYPATVSDFRLDRFEVSVGRLRNFVDAVVAGWRPDSGSGKHTHVQGGSGLLNTGNLGNEQGWDSSWDANLHGTKSAWDGTGSLACRSAYQTWTPDRGDNETLPINCVNWYQAYAFCIWDGGFLPSEAEWNYAAAGGSEQRVYPWGPTSPGNSANYAAYACFYNGSGPSSCTGLQNIAPVGSIAAGDGRYGQADLFGNMWEWSVDAYVDPYATSCVDCAYLPGEATQRSLRGNGFSAGFNGNNTDRYYADGTARWETTGIRCARLP